jgi:hypothetical protein
MNDVKQGPIAVYMERLISSANLLMGCGFGNTNLAVDGELPGFGDVKFTYAASEYQRKSREASVGSRYGTEHISVPAEAIKPHLIEVLGEDVRLGCYSSAADLLGGVKAGEFDIAQFKPVEITSYNKEQERTDLSICIADGGFLLFGKDRMRLHTEKGSRIADISEIAYKGTEDEGVRKFARSADTLLEKRVLA